METPTSASELMKEEIKNCLDQPMQLEKLYRQDRKAFQQSFNSLYPEIKGNPAAEVWNERLNFKEEDILLVNKAHLIFVLIATFIAGMIAKIPDFSGLDPDYFFPRNIGLIIFPLLTLFFLWKQTLPVRKWIFPIAWIAISIVYINFLPNNPNSDTLNLACVHLPLVLWAIMGYAYLGNDFQSKQKRIDYLRYNGDLVVMCAILALSAALFTGITFGLFQLIGINIGEFYAKYVIVFGAPAIPIVGTYLVQNNPQLVNRISPVIARIFTPLVFIMLLFFLAAMVNTAKNPYTDREFLMMFNALLIGVMALIVFSITEATKSGVGRVNLLFLCGLALLTIITNGIALSAIALRIAEFGITPNRLAVLGSNLLIFINLLLVSYQLLQVVRNKVSIEKVENNIAVYLPVYAIWTAVVVYLFPLIFNFL
ncbi:MAG: hypothetical protein RLZ47_1026 [Bacteroidota bacterium]|jgi:hypothetical protein